MEIQYSEKIIPDAYHGTSLENASKIDSNGFNISTGEDQYLGDGAYFFESSLLEAENWAKKYHSPPQAVIKAVVVLGHCLDLVDDYDYHRRKLGYISKKLKERMKADSISDAAVINFVATTETKYKIDTVRARFVHKMFFGSRISGSPYIVICVRNTKNILNHNIEKTYN